MQKVDKYKINVLPQCAFYVNEREINTNTADFNVSAAKERNQLNDLETRTGEKRNMVTY